MPDNTTQPMVTVIMPIRNEEAFIARSLGAVLTQDYPPDRLEVLIADGLSDDRTAEIIQSLPGAERVRIIPNPRRIQAAGLNEAIPHARGDFIVRVDGHTVIAPDYVRQCVQVLQTTGALNVGGAMDPVGVTPLGKALALAGKSPFAVPSAFHISQRAQYTDTVYLGAWPRQVFDRVGFYNEYVGVNEDYELNYRIRKAGGKVYFSPAIRSQYFGRQTLGALVRQYFRYGRSKVMVLRDHPASVRWRHLVAPVFVAGLVGGIVLSLLIPGFWKLWAGSLILYILLSIFFSARIAARNGWQVSLFWRLPLVFFAIHAAWGTGFWIELLHR